MTKEKQSQEMMKLYQEYKINPTSGCLPMLIQMPIILILYQAIYKPLTYMFRTVPRLYAGGCQGACG